MEGTGGPPGESHKDASTNGSAEREGWAMTVRINEQALLKAFEDSSKDAVYFLDRTTGQVITLSLTMRRDELIEMRDTIAKNKGRYLQIEKANPQDIFRHMDEFVQSLKDVKLKERLSLAKDSANPFREFRHILEAYPREKDRWEAFRRTKLQSRIAAWKKQYGLA
jgi:hypothetical protein